MAYSKIVGKALLLLSAFSCLFGLAFLARLSLEILGENVWMVPIFLIGSVSVPYWIYSVRSYWEVFWQAYILRVFRKFKFLGLFEEHEYQTMVLPSDCDVFNHMNNSRYAREADFARTRWYCDTGLLYYFQRVRKYIIMTASTIRYRRSLEVFQGFKIKTKIIYWDEKNIYLQHKFITKDPKTGCDFINAIIASQMRVLSGNTEEFLHSFLKTSTLPEKPKLTTELEHYLKYLTESSNILRNDALFN